MKQMRRAAIYKLAASAHEMELDVMNGILRRDDDGRWHIGDYDLFTWLDAHRGEELALCLAPWPTSARCRCAPAGRAAATIPNWSAPTAAPTASGCAAMPRTISVSVPYPPLDDRPTTLPTSEFPTTL